ncbi:MAG: hypothetical protein WBZ36_26045, partial [Candidatus Nitrosopolaris sp.]
TFAKIYFSINLFEIDSTGLLNVLQISNARHSTVIDAIRNTTPTPFEQGEKFLNLIVLPQLLQAIPDVTNYTPNLSGLYSSKVVVSKVAPLPLPKAFLFDQLNPEEGVGLHPF